MLGKIKKKLEKFVDNRIVNYFSKNKKVEKEVEDEIDISIAEAENKRYNKDLTKNLIYSIQRDFNSLKYTKDGKNYAFDSIQSCMQSNKMTGLTGSPKDIVFNFFTKFGYIGWQICSILAQHWLISNACSISNKDCLRNGWNNTFVDKKDTDMSEEEKEKAQETLNKLFDIEQQKYNLNEKLLKWGYYYNVFGTAFMLPIIDGIDDKAREKPYNPDGIKKGSFKGISVIEPYWMIPEFDLDSMTDPTNINFFEPEYYRTANGKKIHKSHLIIGRRKFVSDILKPSYYYGGISLAQEIYERVYASEKCANEAPLLLLTKRLNVYKVKLKDFFFNPAKYKEMAETITTMRDNQGILFTDRDDEVGQIDTTLSDLDQVIMEQYKLVSAIARIPVDKLFETNPTGGLSASGDYNIKNYNQDLNTLQNDLFRPAIDRINEIVMRSEFESKDRVGIIFNPTDNPTEKEIAELNNQKAQAIQTYLQNNIITPEEARQKLVNDKMSGFAFLKGVEKEEPSEEEQQEIEMMMNKGEGEKEEKEGKDEDDIEWITVKGTHIPIKEGENKGEVVEKFIKEKGEGGKSEKGAGKVEIEKGGEKKYNIEREVQKNKSQKEQSENRKKIIGRADGFDKKVEKGIIEFADKQDDKNLTEDKVIESIQDYDYIDKESGKKTHFSKEDIQREVRKVEERIKKIEKSTADIYAEKDKDGNITGWKKEREDLHEEKLAKIFKGTKPSDNPEIVILGGRGGSGKSRYANKEGYLVLDNDKIKEMLDEYKGWNAKEVHEEAGHILKRALERARENKISIVLDGTLSGEYEKLKNKIMPFIEKGYTLQAHYIHLPRQKSIQRAINRYISGNMKDGRGRYVPIEVLSDMKNNEENFTKLLRDFKARRWSFSSSDVKKGEPIKYMYGNIEEGGKVWNKKK